jgi:membrane-bound lytic murein transglycosylase B
MTNSLPAHPVWIAALALGLALAAVTADATPRERQQTRTRAAAPEGVPYAGREDVLRFAAEVAERRGWDRSWVEQQLAGARKLPVVQRLIMPPPAGTAKNWAAYRARFIEPSRINAGLRFWQAHESWLSQAEARYGVPAEIVVGIIGVETFYGRIMGNFRVLDTRPCTSVSKPGKAALNSRVKRR